MSLIDTTVSKNMHRWITSDDHAAAAIFAALLSCAAEAASNVRDYSRPLHLNQTIPKHVKVIIHPAAAIHSGRGVLAHGEGATKAGVGFQSWESLILQTQVFNEEVIAKSLS